MKTENLLLLYKNAAGSIRQDNKNNQLLILFDGKETRVNIMCFFGLKRKVDQVDFVQLLDDPSAASDLTIINPCGCEHCFVLGLTQLLQFKDLLAGARTMMELNSILSERLYNPLSA